MVGIGIGTLQSTVPTAMVGKVRKLGCGIWAELPFNLGVLGIVAAEVMEEEEELRRMSIVRRRPWQESVVDALLTAEYHPLNLAVASRPTVLPRLDVYRK